MNDLGGHLLGFGGQVGIEGGGFGGVMAEILLDEPEVDTGFQQVGGVGVAQGVDAGFLAEAAGPKSGAKGILDVADGHGSFGGGTVNATPSGSGENPNRVAVGFPVLAEPLQGRVRQGDITIFAPLAAMDVNQLAGAVDVADLKVSAFLQAQAARVNSGETSLIAE